MLFLSKSYALKTIKIRTNIFFKCLDFVIVMHVIIVIIIAITNNINPFILCLFINNLKGLFRVKCNFSQIESLTYSLWNIFKLYCIFFSGRYVRRHLWWRKGKMTSTWSVKSLVGHVALAFTVSASSRHVNSASLDGDIFTRRQHSVHRWLPSSKWI